MVSFGFVISLWAGSSAISAFVDSVVEAHGQTPLRHPVRQRFFALGLYVVMLVFVIASAPFVALGPRKISSYLPDSWDNLLHYGYYPPALVLALVLAVTILYRVSLPKPLPTHRLVWGAVLATTVFVVATMGLRFYLTWITSTGYTYGGAGHPPDRVPAVRVLPRLRDHDRGRTQRRDRGGIPGADAAHRSGSNVAAAQGESPQRRRRPGRAATAGAGRHR